MSTEELYKLYLECGCKVSTDSRTIPAGAIFFALRGENFDGNKYAQKALEAGECAGKAVPEVGEVMGVVKQTFADVDHNNLGVGSTIFAVKPGDGSAREQAASCQKVLGGWANIANEYATKRYRSNLINWGMLPFLIEAGELPFKNLDYIFLPGIKAAVENKQEVIDAYVVKDGGLKKFEMRLGELTDEERQIILKGCLINYNRV